MSTSTSFTYAQLVSAIENWLEDASAELVADIETIISIGESRLATDLNLEIFDRVATGALTASQFVQAIKTSTWQGTRSFFIRDSGGTGDRRFLRRRSYEWCQDYAPDETATDEPEYYAEYSDTEFFVVPAPDATYAFEVREIRGPGHLSSSNANTWLGDNCGDLLLDSCRLAGEDYIKADQEDIERVRVMYQDKLGVRKLELRALWRSDYSPVKSSAEVVGLVQ